MFNLGSTADRKTLKRATPTTIQNKFLVGYQGWFTCAGDGVPVDPGHHGWLHWFDCPIPHGGRPHMDLLPDVSTYSPSELFPAPGLKTNCGEQVFLFSSRHPKTVQRHFHWMAEHGIDGAFLQRFVSQCNPEEGSGGIFRIRDEVGDLVRDAAEKENRVFAIMYDVSEVAADSIQHIIERDWIHLIRKKGLLDSPNYLKERGKPVVALWGFGFDERGHTPALVRSITNYIRTVTPGGAYIIAGTPAHWRTAEGDADRNPAFLEVWLTEFDAICPWTVGRFTDEQGANRFAETKMAADIELIKQRNVRGQRKIDYIPVVLPGASGYNLTKGNWGFNDIKRNGGRFFWKQIFNASRLGVRTMYGAMWDEYDEGTALMPSISHGSQLPVTDTYQFLALDQDGYDLPSDWFMRISGFAAEGLRNQRQIHETFPLKELQDYWSSRPKYEEQFQPDPSRDADYSGGNSQPFEEWIASQKAANEEAPPPPYSLEAGRESAAQSSTRAESLSVTQPELPRTLSDRSFEPVAGDTISAAALNRHTETYSRPPPINQSSRPQRQTVMAQVDMNPSASVSELQNGFGMMDIAEQLQDSPIKSPVVSPPLHPAQPDTHLNRPHTFHATYPRRSTQKPSQPCTSSQSITSPYPTGGSPLTHVSQESRPPSVAGLIPNPWGPLPNSSLTGQSFNSGQQGLQAGAKILRPHHTFTASSLSSSRPGSVSPQPSHGLPNPALSRTSKSPKPCAQLSELAGESAVYSTTGPSSYIPDTRPIGASHFPTGPTSYIYSSAGSLNAPHISIFVHQSQPHTPHSASSTAFLHGNTSQPGRTSSPGFPPGSGQNYQGQNQCNSSSNAQYFRASYGRPHSPPLVGPPKLENIPFPQAQTASGLHPSPAFTDHYDSHNYSTPYVDTRSSGWYPGSSESLNPLPPIPPRPATTVPYEYPGNQRPSFSGASTSSSATSGRIGLALSAVDKMAGKKRRERLESNMESLTQTSTRLFNKLTK